VLPGCHDRELPDPVVGERIPVEAPGAEIVQNLDGRDRLFRREDGIVHLFLPRAANELLPFVPVGVHLDPYFEPLEPRRSRAHRSRHGPRAVHLHPGHVEPYLAPRSVRFLVLDDHRGAAGGETREAGPHAA
jgi:hypothetical protein